MLATLLAPVPARAQDTLTDLDGWRALLSTKHIQEGRQLLREVLAGPLRFTPEGKTYGFEGEASTGVMLAGSASVAPFLVAVRGFVDGCNVKFSGIAA